MNKLVLFYHNVILDHVLQLLPEPDDDFISQLPAIPEMKTLNQLIFDKKWDQLDETYNVILKYAFRHKGTSQAEVGIIRNLLIIARDLIDWRKKELSDAIKDHADKLCDQLKLNEERIGRVTLETHEETDEENAPYDFLAIGTAIGELKKAFDSGYYPMDTTSEEEQKESAAEPSKETRKRKQGGAFRYYHLDEEFIGGGCRDVYTGTRANFFKKSKNLPDSQNIYYIKFGSHELGDINNDVEVVTQEFARIFKVAPKTRLALSMESTEIGVASKEVKELKLLSNFQPPELMNNLNNGKWEGFESAAVLTLFLDDIDFSLDNVGVSEDKQIVKFDGNRNMPTLLGFSKQDTNRITSEHIDNLLNGIFKLHCDADLRLDSTPARKAKLLQVMLNILILPDEYFHAFAAHYAKTKQRGEKIAQGFIAKCNEFREAAQQNASFCEYMQTRTEMEDLHIGIARIQDFVSTKRYRVADSIKNLAKLMELEFQNLSKSSASKIPAASHTPSFSFASLGAGAN